MAAYTAISTASAFVEKLDHGVRHKTIHQFPNNTWVENIAVRGNGNLLVTLITAAEVWEVNPFNNQAELVHHFPNASSALGITELQPDVFVVAIGTWNPSTFQPAPGSWSVWSINYHEGGEQSHRSPVGGPIVQKIVDLPEAGFLNGVTNLPSKDGTVLIADSLRGVIYRVDTKTGSHSIAIDSPALKPNQSAPAALGVNGIHFRRHEGQPYLYFSNSFKRPVLGRFLLNADGSAADPYETIIERATWPTNLDGQADDFTFDRNGDVWLTTDPSNTLLKVNSSNSHVNIVAGGVDEAVIAGDTAAAFGRTSRDSEMLYVTTNGGMAFPPPTGVVGGKIVAFDTKSL